MSRKILGLDINDNAVSAVIVRGGIKGNRIEEHRYIPLSTEQDNESLSMALGTIAAEMDLEGATCIASLPAGLASYRNMEVPFKEPKKLRQILPYELESILPYAPEDVTIDFNVLESFGGVEQHHVFAAAVKKESVGFYLDQLKAHGIEPEVLTIGGYALAQALAHYSDDNADRLLVSIEPGQATLFLILNNSVSLVRSSRVHLNTKEGVNHFCTTVHQTVAGFQKHAGLDDINIQEVVLTGSALEDAQVENAIIEELEMPATTLDLIALSGQVSIDTEGIMWKITTMDASLALALSAIVGLDSLNFRRGGFTVQKGWVQYQGDILRTGLIAALVLLLFFANVVTDYFSMKKRSLHLEEEVRKVFTSTFPEVQRIVDPLQQMRVKLDELKTDATFSSETGRQVMAIDILNDISRYIPAQIDVVLSSIIIGGDSVLISGDTGGFDAVDDVKNSLENAVLFKTVSITSTNKDRGGNRVRFKIKAVI